MISVKGNSIGIGADGSSALSPNIGMSIFNQCDLEVGGDDPSYRNYIGNTTTDAIVFRPSNDNIYNYEFYNNYIGRNPNGGDAPVGDESFRLPFGFDYAGAQNPIVFGASGKGNFITNAVTGVSLTADRDVTIAYNTINAEIPVYLDQSTSDPMDGIFVRNNYIASTETIGDPYFNETFPELTLLTWFSPAVWVYGTQATFQGNHISGYMHGGYMSSYISPYGNTTWGGQDPLVGSLCGGVEKNCINDNVSDSNTAGGGLWFDISGVTNEATIWEDNDFGAGNGPDLDVDVRFDWRGNFELFSGTNRRTDLGTTATLVLDYDKDAHDVDTGTFEYDAYDILIRNISCTGGAVACPTAGSTSGLESFSAGFGVNNFWPQVYFSEYIIDHSGTKIDKSLFHFDRKHFASQEFSFDGDNTTAPVSPDLAQSWTENAGATRDPISSWTEMQIMEVNFVDANPILQDDSSYIIYVDSPTNEDNASAEGYDDGDGAYSGGR